MTTNQPNDFGRTPPPAVPEPRDPRGRFVPGCPAGPGRPPGSRALDLRAIAAAAAADDGVDLNKVLWQVVQSLAEAATAGDVNAARLLIERLCGKDVVPVAVAGMTLEELVLASSGELVHEHDDDPRRIEGH